MPSLHLTSQTLRDLALRGEHSVQAGRKLLLIHVGNWSSYYEEVTAVSGLIRMKQGELDSMRGFKSYSDKDKMVAVFLYRKGDGIINYRHAADGGILPYNMGEDNAFFNPSNFTLDKKALRKLGIKIQK